MTVRRNDPDHWSDRDRAVLTALAETFVPGDADHRARLAAEALTASADPSQVRQLRLALRLMDSAAANLLLAGRPRSFGAMSEPDRERYLLRWATARLGMRRSAFAAFRKLLTFLAYADPGIETPNPRLARIGYRPDDPPVTSDPCAIRAITLPASTGRAADEPTVLDGREARGPQREARSARREARSTATASGPARPASRSPRPPARRRLPRSEPASARGR